MAHTYTQSTISWRQMGIPIAISAGFGYMISNGFNAVNVQLRNKGIHAVILASDLSVPSNLSEAVEARTTTVTRTVSEMMPRNLISNTVLRNAVLPRVAFKQTLCSWEQTRHEGISWMYGIPFPTVDYGFTQRDWQSRVLQEALPANTLKLVVNPSKRNTKLEVNNSQLPMNASLAADLLLYMMFVAPRVLPWGNTQDFVDKAALEKRYPSSTPAEKKKNFVEKTAIVTGLLPPSDNASEEEKRDWFLKAVSPSVIRQFNASKNTSRSDINVTFSHVAISPSIDFDAVTFEVEMDPTLLSTVTSKTNATRFTQLAQANAPGYVSNCGPWPALCLVRKPLYQPQPNEVVLEPYQQVHAFSSCATKDGDTLMSSYMGASSFDCKDSSNSSFMVMSVGRRLVADALVQNKSDNVTEIMGGGTALATNLHKIYTFTIGRLSWRLEDLGKIFNADCGTKSTTHKCRGLHFPLSSKTLSESGLVEGEEKNQSLVVNAEGIPTQLILPSRLISTYRPRSVPLVEVSESPSQSIIFGDTLLPHNIDKIEWRNDTVKDACDADIESLLYSRLNNHIYIEHGFQTAYTAATFFLLQNAVVKDAVAPDRDMPARTLNFAGNTQEIAAVVSTPLQNTLQTLVGCGLLLLAVVVAVSKTSFFSQDSDPLADITTPQAIARVMVHDMVFPPLLLHRRVVDVRGEEHPKHHLLEEYTITQLTTTHTSTEDDGVVYTSRCE